MTNHNEKICANTHNSCNGTKPNESENSGHQCQPYLYRCDSRIDCSDENIIGPPTLRDFCHLSCPIIKIPNPPKPKISSKNEERVRHKVEDVQNVFTQALQFYKPNEIMFSFNGGKDCTVVLDMLAKFYRNTCLKHIRLPVLYIQTEDSFPEVDEFVDKCAQLYPIELVKYKGDMKEAIKYLLQEFPEVKAVVMGLRSSDPHCQNLRVMQHTDPDWPPLMRINPILDWSYCDIWNYILFYDIPYCALYDQGYTSIGTKSNTRRNEFLKCVNPNCKEGAYFPAYSLEDGAQERAGRR